MKCFGMQDPYSYLMWSPISAGFLLCFLFCLYICKSCKRKGHCTTILSILCTLTYLDIYLSGLHTMGPIKGSIVQQSCMGSHQGQRPPCLLLVCKNEECFIENLAGCHASLVGFTWLWYRSNMSLNYILLRHILFVHRLQMT